MLKYSGIFENEKELQNGFKDGVGVEGRINQSKKEILSGNMKTPPESYVKMLELINKEPNKKVIVCDIGGGAGIDFFRLYHLIKNPSRLKWIVYEVEEVYEKYDLLFKSLDYNICCKSVNSFDLFKKQKDCINILHSAGTIQYLESPLIWLEKSITNFDCVVLKDLNMSKETKTFLTIQKGNGFCWFYNQKEFLDIFEKSKFKCDIFYWGKFHDMSNFPEAYRIHSFGQLFAIKNDKI